MHLCDRSPSPAEIAFRAAVDRSEPFVWTTQDRHALSPELDGVQTLVLGPTRWTLAELEHWAEILVGSPEAAVWIPAAEFDESCFLEANRWEAACAILGKRGTLGVSDEYSHKRLHEAGIPCHYDPSPMLSSAMEHGESSAGSRIIGLSLSLPLSVDEHEQLSELASVLKGLEGHRLRVLLAQRSDSELLPWLHGTGLQPEKRVLHDRQLSRVFREVAGLAALVTNRGDLAESAQILGVPTLEVGTNLGALTEAARRLSPPKRTAAVCKTASMMAESARKRP